MKGDYIPQRENDVNWKFTQKHVATKYESYIHMFFKKKKKERKERRKNGTQMNWMNFLSQAT